MAHRLMVLILVSLCVFSLAGAQQKRKTKSGKKRVGAIVKDLEKNISAIWKEVDMLSQPVHVHIHGDGHLMDYGDHDDGYDVHGHDHDDHDHEHSGHDDHHPHDHGPMEHEMHETEHVEHKDHDDKDHKHDHKYPQHRLEHDKDGTKHDHHGKAKMKKMKGCNCKKDGDMMGKRGHGDHTHMHRGHGIHDGHDGTHVHIHLHTAMEEEMEMKHHLMSPPPLEYRYRYARCDVVGNSALPFVERQTIEGPVFFRQMPGQPLEMEVNLKGFVIDHRAERHHQHLRGFHAHEFGDLSDGCINLGSHYNPHGVDHNGHDEEPSHPGDWGNLHVEEDGTVVASFKDKDASLFGPQSLLGRGIVIHAGADDLGKGEDEGSKRSGNAGARIACCAIVACPEPAGVWFN